MATKGIVAANGGTASVQTTIADIVITGSEQQQQEFLAALTPELRAHFSRPVYVREVTVTAQDTHSVTVHARPV